MTVTTFVYTGAAQIYTVPAGVTSITIKCVGADGGRWNTAAGGQGATVQGVLAVTAGTNLQVNVGQAGQLGSANSPGLGGWNGGGNGGYEVSPGAGIAGQGAGGASDVRQGGTALSNRVIVAGGGGGSANNYSGGGGGAIGGSGLNGQCATVGNQGNGGTQSAGGASAGGTGVSSSAGALGVGSGGANNLAANNASGGGGGGFWGASGGGATTGTGADAGAGGGGSTMANGCTSPSSTAGTTGGGAGANGSVTITTTDTAPNAPTLTLPVSGGFADITNTALGWTFSDPDSGDTQSSADVRYRVLGIAADWTVLPGVVTGAASTYQLTGLTLGVIYEWQVRTYDSQGTVGPYSASSTFTVKSHPAISIISPLPGTSITNMATQSININQVKDQNGVNARRVADNNGQPDTSTVYETNNFLTQGSSSFGFSNTGVHPNGPEHWQFQITTFSGQIVSDWFDIPVVMSLNPPPTPTVVATAQPNAGAIQVVATLAEASMDFFRPNQSGAPTVADTGQTITNTNITQISANLLVVNSGANGSQAMTLANKVLAMQCAFRMRADGSTHTNSIYMVATDASNNAHIYCGIDAQHWYIKLDTAGTLTTLVSGTLTTALTSLSMTQYPFAMSATISGTTVTFTDPLGTVHTATNASIGSFTGKIAQILLNNSVASGDDNWGVSHWSANSVAALNTAYAYISRSLTGGNDFVPIPASAWEAEENGAVFTYTDYTAPFNRRVWYQAVGVTATGAIAKSAVS